MYSGKQFTHFICREKRFMHFFVGKTIYALCLESFCALKVAIRKVQILFATFDNYGNLGFALYSGLFSEWREQNYVLSVHFHNRSTGDIN